MIDLANLDPPNIEGVWSCENTKDDIYIYQDKGQICFRVGNIIQTGIWMPRYVDNVLVDWDGFLVDELQETFGKVHLAEDGHIEYQFTG